MPEIKFSRADARTIAAAIDARNAKLKSVREAIDRAQLDAQQASSEYDLALLEILQENGYDKLPEASLEPMFFPAGSKRPEGIRWKDEPAAKAPPQGKAALDAAVKELKAGLDPKNDGAQPPPAAPLAAQVAATP